MVACAACVVDSNGMKLLLHVILERCWVAVQGTPCAGVGCEVNCTTYWLTEVSCCVCPGAPSILSSFNITYDGGVGISMCSGMSRVAVVFLDPFAGRGTVGGAW